MPTRPRLILVHPGFHKTATSSTQHLLWANRAVLRPATAVLLLRHLRPVADICLRFSRLHSPVGLSDLVDAMDRVLAQHLPPNDKRDLVLSCEGLSGHLPGWPGVETYAAAPIIAAFLTGYLADRFPDADLRLVYTTRDPDAWLSSAWRHHLLGQRLRLDWPEFAARYRRAADLPKIVAEVADAVDPVAVHARRLEDSSAHPAGPGGAILDLLDLPPDILARITPVGLGNAGPDASLAAAFLALNRSDLPDETVRLRKTVLAEQAGTGGWAQAT